MQAQVQDVDRLVVQTGSGLGEREGCAIVELADEDYAALLAALAAPNGGVRLAEDGAITVLDPPAEPDPPPSDTELYGGYLDMVQEVSSDVGVQILTEVVRGLLR